MSQSVRHRLPEFGVLEALGIGDTAVWLLVIAESSVLCFVAAAIGLTVAAVVFPSVFSSLVGPTPPVSWNFYLSGLAIALLLAVTSATLPALRARRLRSPRPCRPVKQVAMSSLRQTFEITLINLRAFCNGSAHRRDLCRDRRRGRGVHHRSGDGDRFENTFSSAARDDRAIVMSNGAHSEAISSLSRADLASIESAHGIRRTARGRSAFPRKRCCR